MNRNDSDLHSSDPAYDPVLDGVRQGLADLFPPIHNPPREPSAAKDDVSDPDTDDVGDNQP